MSRTLIIGGVAALALATAIGGVAVAQQPAERPAPRAHRADADGDGRISQAEFVGRRIDRLTAADADRDGSVTREEMQAQRQARMQQRAETRFARLDTDSDGAISREEFTARPAARADGAPRPTRARFAHGRHGPRVARHGGSGAERGPIAIVDVRAKTEQAFARLDADHDGFVTAQERRAGMQAAREHRRERMTERRAAPQASRPAPASE